MFRLGYNTNGLAHHRLLDAMRLLAETGYEAVSITPDVGQLDPYQLTDQELEDVRRWSDDLGLALSVETGARFLMDARRKHFPTLLEDDPRDRERRIDFLKRSVGIARAIGADVVSLWSGAAPDGTVADWPHERRGDAEGLWRRLIEGLREVVVYARTCEVRVAFEPEPGMFLATTAGYAELLERMPDYRDEIGLCLDVGHVVVTGEATPAEVIRAQAERLWHVHLDDCPAGVHEHRMFGAGDLDLEATLKALLEVGYGGIAAVELSRDSHRGAEASREALARVKESLTRPG